MANIAACVVVVHVEPPLVLQMNKSSALPLSAVTHDPSLLCSTVSTVYAVLYVYVPVPKGAADIRALHQPRSPHGANPIRRNREKGTGKRKG